MKCPEGCTCGRHQRAPLSPERREEWRRKISESKRGKQSAPLTPEAEAERRRKIGEGNRGRPRPDLAALNRTEAMRSRPRTISDEARQRMSAERTTHGQSRSRITRRKASLTYNIWAAMVQRCTNPNSRDWHLYGARGIRVCPRWHKFENFLADMGEKPDGLSIERIDNDGPCAPWNCKWATALEQAQNKRSNGRQGLPPIRSR